MAKQKPTPQKEVKEYWSFPNLDRYFEKKQEVFFYLSLAFLILFTIFLFDVRIDEGGDDSGYLLDAKRFIEGKAFPGWHGALYSIIIGWFIKLVGFKLVFFKFLSFLFLIGHQVFLYLALKDRISPFLLSVVLLTVSVMSGINYFGSQTYTEAFYMLLQSLFFFVFLKYVYDNPNNISHLRSKWWTYLVLGLSIFMLATTRNVGVVALIVVVFCLVAELKFIPALASVVGYFVLKIPYGIYKKVVWNMQTTELSGQLTEMKLKNPYNSALGQEDFSGMMTRIVENCKNYFSRVLMHETGLKDPSNTATNTIVPVIIIAVLLIGLFFAYRNKRSAYRPIFIYLGMSFGATFIALSQMWSQARLIVIYIPLLFIVFFWTLAQIDKKWSFKFARLLGILLLTIIFLKSFFISVSKAQEHSIVLKKNLAGDRYYGYTPDWVNYLKVSEWAGKNVPANEVVGSRKASMSFIYGGGKEFYPINKIPFVSVDTILNYVNKSGKEALYINESGIKNNRIAMAVKPRIYGIIFAENLLYSVCLVSKEQKDSLSGMLSEGKIEFYSDQAEFRKVLSKHQNLTGAVPDDLLARLKNRNVHYLIMANLRVNPNQKSERTINTVERYAGIIELKYPGIYSLVNQSGSENNEPAKLIRIEYGRYGL